MNDPCTPWRDRLWATLDAEGDPTASNELLDHLRGCAACRIAFDHAIRADRLLHAAAVAATPLTLERPRHASTAIHRRITTVRRRKPRRTSILPWIGVAAALLVAVLALTASPSRPTSNGFITVETAIVLTGSDGTKLAVGSVVASPGDLRGGPATLRLHDGSRVWLDAGTHVVLQTGGTLRAGQATGVLIRLDQGALGIAAKPQDATAPLAVQTPLAEAVVVGTAFRMAHDANGSDLTVTGGTVKLIAADGVRLISAGGQVRVEAPAPATTVLASFSAASVGGAVAIGQPIPAWNSGSLRADAPSGTKPPILRQLGAGYGLCFNGVDQRLATTLGTIDPRHGLTLIALVIPINPGRDQRVVALTDGSREVLALVRHDLEPGSIAAVVDGSERLRADLPTGKHWSVACRLLGDGSVVINTAAGPGRRTNGGRLAPITSAHLHFGGAAQGRALEGDLIAIELHAGALDDAALTARVRALAAANHFPLTTW